MPHCQTLPLFPQFFFRRPSFKLDALKAPWADADADADAETETQNRHLQHGITYKFRMHDFALFWYLSNTCALNEVGVAVEVWVAVGVAVWCLEFWVLSLEMEMHSKKRSASGWDETMLPLNDHAEHEKHERSQRQRRRLLDLSKAYSNLLPELTTSAQLWPNGSVGLRYWQTGTETDWEWGARADSLRLQLQLKMPSMPPSHYNSCIDIYDWQSA